MNSIRRFAAVLAVVPIVLLTVSCGGNMPKQQGLASFDERVQLTFDSTGGANGSTLTYTILFNGAEIIVDAPLGVRFADGSALGDGMTLNNVAYTEGDESYTMPHGKAREIRNHYRSAVLDLSAPDGRRLGVEFRVYDDGVAYRYLFPEGAGDLAITGETSGFYFTADHRFWGLLVPGYETSYEFNYTVGTLAHIPADTLVALPLLVEVADSVWCAITEANLTDYAGMYLTRMPGPRPHFAADLSPLPDGSGVCVRAGSPHQSPWRVIMLGDNPGRLAESNIVLNLNDPPASDFSWVEPGKAAWNWWSDDLVANGRSGGMNNATMKYFIDFAGEQGLKYMLVDAGWYPRYDKTTDDITADGDITASIPAIDVPELVRYAAERGVDIILWIHWKPAMAQMDKAFPLYEQWGVKGVKVDFMNRDDQEMVAFYHRVLETAAKHHLLVDFHGAYKPTGEMRTWPNEITREGVLGLEYVKWSDKTNPVHDCTIPFTRGLAGHMDFTPGGFNNATRETFVSRNLNPMTLGTRCHQLALFAVLESGMMCLADSPLNYRGAPGLDFLKAVPCAWDETRVVNASVGEYCTFARRSGNEWYLGSITDWTARELAVPLKFLGEGNWDATIFADGPDAATNARDITIGIERVSAGDTLTLRLAPGGGCAVRFVKAE